jgi:hypothetical protein
MAALIQLVKEEVEFLATIREAGQLNESEWKDALAQHQAMGYFPWDAPGEIL